MIDETFIPPHRCPRCNYRMDCTTDAYGEAKPKEGDVSICLMCGGLMVFNADLTVRKPTKEENLRFQSDPSIMRAQIMAAHITGAKPRQKKSGQPD